MIAMIGFLSLKKASLSFHLFPFTLVIIFLNFFSILFEDFQDFSDDFDILLMPLVL